MSTLRQTRLDLQATLTRCIEHAPAEYKRNLMVALEAFADARPNMREHRLVDMFLDAVEEGVMDEIIERDETEGETVQQ